MTMRDHSLPTNIAWCRPPHLRRRQVLELRAHLQVAVGVVLRRRRHELGINATRMAEMCETHRPLVHRVERGTTEINVGTLVRYALALNCNVSDILREAEAMQKEASHDDA